MPSLAYIVPEQTSDRRSNSANPCDGRAWRTVSRKRLRLSFTLMTGRPLSRRTAEGAVAAFGAVLVFSAIAVNQAWLDRHFLPSFMISRRWLVGIETTIRVVFAISGIALMLPGRVASARLITRRPRAIPTG